MLKKIHDLLHFLQPIGTVGKSHAPEDYQRLAAMVQIGLLPAPARHLQPIHQVFPVTDHRRIVAWPHPGKIIHDGNGAMILFRRLQGMLQHRIIVMQADRTFDIGNKTLDKNTIHTIILHPFKMQIRRGFIV